MRQYIKWYLETRPVRSLQAELPAELYEVQCKFEYRLADILYMCVIV